MGSKMETGMERREWQTGTTFYVNTLFYDYSMRDLRQPILEGCNEYLRRRAILTIQDEQPPWLLTNFQKYTLHTIIWS